MQKYTAIILASRDVNEVNRLYIMYTLEQGLVKAVAKGVRKPTAKLAGHLEPGTLSEIYLAKSRGMGQITGAITLENFENAKKDFGKLAEILKIFKFFTKNFSEGEKDGRIFLLLKEFLEFVSQNSSQSLALGVEAFWWKIFYFLGQKPEIMKCVKCGGKLRSQSPAHKPKLGFSLASSHSQFLKAKLYNSSRSNLKYFSVEKGGIICSRCVSNVKSTFIISDNQIKLLRIFWGNSLLKIAKVKIDKIEIEKLAKTRENYTRYYFS